MRRLVGLTRDREGPERSMGVRDGAVPHRARAVLEGRELMVDSLAADHLEVRAKWALGNPAKQGQGQVVMAAAEPPVGAY